MANELYPELRTCSKCSEAKPLAAYGECKRGVLRAMCRTCYNVRRRAHYAENLESKNLIRREYEGRPDVTERRKAKRRSDAYRAKEREAMIRYKTRPEVAERLKAWRVAYEVQPKVRARIIVLAAQARAKKCNLPMTIDVAWAEERLQAGVCEVTGIAFDLMQKETRRNPFAPSVDQIKSGHGYTPENSRLVLVAVNLALADWGLDQFLFIARKAVEFNRKKRPVAVAA